MKLIIQIISTRFHLQVLSTRSFSIPFKTIQLSLHIAQEDLLNSFPFLPDLIRVSDTWLKSELDKDISLAGYNFIHETSVSRAGGVALYVSNKFNDKSLYHD